MEQGEITAIVSRRGSKRREVFVDGAYWTAMPSSVVAALDLSIGDAISVPDVDARRAEIEPKAARERAFRLLAYRDRSRSEIASRLTADGFLEDVVSPTVAWLVDTGLVDDERFAEQMARSLITVRRYGRQRALRDLRRSGVADEEALRAIDAVAPEDNERDRALGMARQMVRSTDSVERLAARLARRGFSTADSLAAAHACLPDAPGPFDIDDPGA